MYKKERKTVRITVVLVYWIHVINYMLKSNKSSLIKCWTQI